MRLTIRTSLALRALMYCAANPGQSVRTRDIAATCNVSENHLVQVVHALGQLGLVVTQRGRNGGLRLARPMAEINIGTVVRQLEGSIPLVECHGPPAGDGSDCPLREACRLNGALAAAMAAFYAALERVTLADLIVGNTPLQQQLARDLAPSPASN